MLVPDLLEEAAQPPAALWALDEAPAAGDVADLRYIDVNQGSVTGMLVTVDRPPVARST